MERIKSITPLVPDAMESARQQWDSIAKPLGSLGLLEKAVIQIAGITGTADVSLHNRCVVVMCADNGVVCEGVTQTGSEVTGIVARAIAGGTSNVNLLAARFGASVFPVDIGMKEEIFSSRIAHRKISYGTRNIAEGAAMTPDEAQRAVAVGMDVVRGLKEKGYHLIVTGEMGIGNTTTSSAIASVLLNLPPESVTGRGAGLSDEGLKKKTEVIRRAIAVNQPDSSKPLELIAKLGGYDIAGMTGLFLGGAVYRVPVVIDGFISAVSAALAAEICPLSKEYMLCSHVSKEPAGSRMLEFLGKKPLITAELCLGEGTGGLFLLPLLDGALAVYRSAHRFDSLPMERYVALT